MVKPAFGLKSSNSTSCALPLFHAAFLEIDVNSLTGTGRREGSAGGGVTRAGVEGVGSVSGRLKGGA